MQWGLREVFSCLVAVYLYRLHQALKILQNEQRMAFSAAIVATLVSAERGVQPVPFKGVV